MEVESGERAGEGETALSLSRAPALTVPTSVFLRKERTASLMALLLGLAAAKPPPAFQDVPASYGFPLAPLPPQPTDLFPPPPAFFEDFAPLDVAG